ncbi:MAG TPA: YciI family protein [Gemmatimonadaceae bacterium]|nr:YciI family protein [Gemmatimonadaceae bacterium]
MKKYMAIIKMSEKYRGEAPPKPLMDAMGPFVEKGYSSGRIVDTGGLKSSDTATRFRLEKGKLTVSDGPFTEAKEVIGGWAILQASTRKEALETATEFMELHRIHWPSLVATSELFEMDEQPGA